MKEWNKPEVNKLDIMQTAYGGGHGQHVPKRIEFQHYGPVEHHQRHAYKGNKRAVHRVLSKLVPFYKEFL